MPDKTYNIRFLCPGNSARSIMAEALVTTMCHGRFKEVSAGSQPGEKESPFAIEKVRETGYPVESPRSTSWDEFAKADAAPMDFIVTVCDNLASEACPFWPGRPASARWSLKGTDGQKRAGLNQVFRPIVARMHPLLALPMEKLERQAIRRQTEKIGDTAVIRA